MVFISSAPKFSLFSRPSTPCFFKESDFLIKYLFYGCEVSKFFSVNVLIRWFFMKIPTKLQVRHSSFFSSPVDSIQAFGVDNIFFIGSHAFHVRSSYRRLSYLFTSHYSFVPECWRYLRRFAFPFLIPFKLSRGCYLLWVISFNQRNLSFKSSTVFLLSGP